MRKFSFFLVPLLCLCASTAWGNSVDNVATFTNNRSNNSSYSDYTITNGSGDEEITFTLTSKYYGSGNYYYISENNKDAQTISWTSPSNPTKCIVVKSITIVGRKQNNGGSMSFMSTFGGATKYEILHDRETSWQTRTMSISSNADIMSSVGLVNGQQIIISNGSGGECQFQSIAITYDIVSAPVFQYRTGNSDDATAQSAYRTQYTATANFAADNANPQWIRDYASNLLTENSTANLSNYMSKISNLQSYSSLYSQYTAGNTNLNFTGLISNSNFDNLPGNWNYGWSGTGSDKASVYARQSGNAKFTNNFAEKWVAKSSDFTADGDINQTITLPRGVYNLKANIISKNISSQLYVNVPTGDGTGALIDYKNGETVNERGVIFEITAISSTITIGYSNKRSDNKSSSDTWVAIDDFVLTLIGFGTNLENTLTNPDFQNATWSYGWSGTGSQKVKEFVQGSRNGNFTDIFAEMYKTNKLEADGDIYQNVPLATGYYKFKATALSSNIYSSLYAKVGDIEYNDWFTGSGSSSDKAIIFYVPSAETVRLGYKTRNYNSSASTTTWVAVDNFTLAATKKLDINITGGGDIETGVTYVDNEISSAFTFAYNDNDIATPSPTLGSESSDFYYTITTNTISSIKTGCDGDHTNDVITYDPSTNTIKAWNAGTATITFTHVGTNVVNAKEVSFNITVSKIANPITVTLDGVNRNSKNISFSTDVSFSYLALNSSEVTITKRDGGAGATTLNNEKTIFTSSAATEGVDYWDLSIAENYKYEGSSTFVRIQVNATPEEESYLYTYLIDGSDYEIQDNGSIVINLDYSPLEIRYQAKRNNVFSIVKCACTSYYANGDEIKRETDDLGTGFGSKTHVLPEDTRKIVLSRSGTTGTPIVKEIYVVRRTYVNATADKANLGEVLVGNTETATITVNWGTSNGKDISVGSSNDHFTVSSETIAVTDNSNGTANITVTYTPVAGTLGVEQAIITLHDRYHTATVNLQATAINNKTLVNGYGFMYNSSHKIKIDDEGTKVYEALYTSETHTVTLQELEPVSSNLIIPAGKVVLLYKADYDEQNPVTYYEYSTADNSLVSPVSNNNCFTHHDGSSTDNINYVLAKKNGVVAFYKYTGDEEDLRGYNVLQLPSGAAGAPSMIRIVTEDNTATALVPVYEENSAAAGQKANSKKIFIDGHLYIQQGNNLYDALGRKVQ